MSRITLSGNASGTGNFTLASPNSNTDRTLTLPDATGTVVVSGATPELGGVYLGGSGSANLLDDYEEGTFTPTFGGGTWTYGARDSYYTKIGNSVTLSLRIVWTARSGSGDLYVNNLPFLPFAGITAARAGGSLGTFEGVDTGGGKQIVVAIDGNLDKLLLRFVNDNASWTAVQLQDCNSVGEVQLSITYQT
jgi:hypothetical protein